MQKQTTVIVILAVLAVSLLGYFAWIANSGKKRYNWYESYDPSKGDAPYGTLYLRKMLEDYHPESKFTFNEHKPLVKLLKDTRPNTDYIFVGPSIYLNDDEIALMLEFIESGNEVFIASNNFPHSLVSKIYTDSCVSESYYYRPYFKSVRLNFHHPELAKQNGYEYKYREHTEDVKHHWAGLVFRTSCDPTGAVTPLGYQDPGGINFVKISYGSGALYIHTNPIVFTNYFLTKADKLEYASGVFGHLTGKDIIFDEFNKEPFDMSDDEKYSSPLYFILQQPALKYAWWMLLATVVLYAIFAGRRRQRVIPVLEKKVNTSLEFVRLVSTLYFQNGNPLDMARKKMRYFLYLVRSRYGIHSPSMTTEQMILLAEKSKVSLPEIRSIFDQYEVIEKGSYYNTQTDKLISLYNAIENFKQKCK